MTAVIYCRVARSADAEREKENNVAKFAELFGYEPTKIFTDIGKSGRDNNRPEYRRMINNALNGKIDRIVVKSIDKFNRNTAAAIKTIRQLREKGVEVFIMQENHENSICNLFAKSIKQ